VGGGGGGGGGAHARLNLERPVHCVRAHVEEQPRRGREFARGKVGDGRRCARKNERVEVRAAARGRARC